MKLDGVTVEAEWDGETLRARGRNGSAHRKFAGKDRAHEGDVLIPKSQVARAYLREASRMTHGELGVRTNDGRQYAIVFKAKHAEPFSRVARDLGA